MANIWDLIRYLRPFSAFETLFIQHLRPLIFVIWGPFQHLRPSSFNIWDLIGYLRLFSAFDTLLADSAAHRFGIRNPKGLNLIFTSGWFNDNRWLLGKRFWTDVWTCLKDVFELVRKVLLQLHEQIFVLHIVIGFCGVCLLATNNHLLVLSYLAWLIILWR